MQPTVIVSSGRCGSTMMGNLINAHEDILSLSEFIMNVTEICTNIEAAFTMNLIDGKDFWQRISRIIPEITLMLKNDIIYDELIYPYQSAHSVFNKETGVPGILMATLPHLSDDPDALYASLETFICAQPESTIRWHYDNLFAWLMTRFNRKTWVERSGGCVLFLDQMLGLWPDAKYIHIVRNGMDTSVSMSKHEGFRLLVVIKEQIKHYLGVDPYRSSDRSRIESLPPELRCFLPENFDREAFLNYQISIEPFAQVWLNQVTDGFTKLANFSKDQLLTVSYDRFCHDPQSQLRQIIEFVGVECSDIWLEQVTRNVRPSGGQWKKLAKDEQAILHRICAPGTELIQQYVDSGLII